MKLWRRLECALLAVMPALIGVPVFGAEILTADGPVAIEARLSVFERGDRVLDSRGAPMKLRALLRARATHEFVTATSIDIERHGRRLALPLPAVADWGLKPMVPAALPAIARQRAPDAREAALAAEERGAVALARWDGVAAEAAWREALALREGAYPDDIATLKARLGVAEALVLRRDLANAIELYDRSAAQLAERWPQAPLRMRALVGRVAAAIEKRDLAGAERQLAAIDSLLPTVRPSPRVAIELDRVRGRWRYYREDIDGARRHYEPALADALRLLPDSPTVALIDTNLGVVEWRQGDLDGAERRYARALAIVEREAPGSVLMGGILMNLGGVHHLRRDYAAAMRNYRRAADLFSAVSATSGETLRVLTNLAMAQGLGGDPRGAIDTLRRILAVQETRTPHGLDVAYTYNALGLNHTRLDAWAEASANYSRAVAIREQNGLLGMGLANTLTSRAYALIPEKKLAEARADLARALAIYDRLAPAGHARAEALHLLGVLERDAGNRRAALDLFRRAVDVLDAQQANLGGSDEARSSYSAFYSSYYKDYAELLLLEKREPAAFETLERYRGRVLRATLAGEGRVMDGALPDTLRRERDELRGALERAQSQLQSIEKPAENAAEVARLLAELETRRASQDVLAVRIRELAPQLADLESTSASTLGEVRASLPAGTALVSYMVQEDGVRIFVVPPGRSGAAIASVYVPIGAGELRVQVDRLAFLLSTPAEAPDTRAALRAASERLYALLVEPVESKLRRYPEWIVVPDGPLHRLPFAALIEKPAQAGTRPRYLVESHVLTTVVSATVYGQLRRRAARPASLAGLVAFGDPKIAADARLITRAPLGDTLRDELMRPLPWARAEVEEIGRVVGGAQVYVGAEATEARVRTVAPRATALHFASHGVLDEQSPLDSFLLLAAPAASGGPADDGRLTAREVLDLPPLSAQLVTLSACSTSASADSDGEGLMGLTRAFQANGANAVVSSLWKVSDRSTSELMLEFYRHWPRATAAQALAAAQRRYVDRHPFYWAAFEVSGAQGIR